MLDEKSALKQIIIDTMPTAAVASGFVDRPGHTQWMAKIIAQHRLRPESAGTGVSALSRWLASQGIEHTRPQAVALQDHWILEDFRALP